MKITVNTKNLGVFECLSSVTRIRMIELLRGKPMNISELAATLSISPAIVTRHINLMDKAGIIKTESIPGKRGLQKVCTLKEKEIILVIGNGTESEVRDNQTVSIPVGLYNAYDVSPTCGLASNESLIGISDDPRYFSDPRHVDAALIWFQSGWVEYHIPSYVITNRPIHSIRISIEICSEFPVYNENWPSDICFYLNNVALGTWTSPGDFGKRKGTYTPAWWRGGTEYGLLKTLSITSEGTMIDGNPLSDTTIAQLNLQHGMDIPFRIAVPKDAYHCGGINIFGRGFGNYNQDIEVVVEYQS